MTFFMYTCAAVVMAASGAATADEQTYDIALSRPMHVGQQMSVVAEGSEMRTITAIIDGKSQQLDNSEITIEFNADAHVLSIDEQGRPTKIQYTIKACSMNMNGTKTIIAPKDSIIFAERNEETQDTEFTTNGEAFGPNETAALALVIWLDRNGPTDDDIFGSNGPQNVGSKWPVNTAKAIEALTRDTNLPISGSDVKGHSTLLAVRNEKGEPCLMISSRLSIENFVPGFDELPRGFELKRAFATTMAQGLFPINDTLPKLQDSLNMNLDAVLIGSLGPDQPSSVLQISSSRVATRRYTVLNNAEKVATGQEN